MIEVRIRKETEPTTHAVTLCVMPVDEIQGLVESILRWGLFFDGGDGSRVGIRCQYVYYNSEAYFEIIIGEQSQFANDQGEDSPE